MKALITGASSGIGRDTSRYLFNLGYNLIIVARNKDGLDKLKEDLLNKSNLEDRQIIVIQEDMEV